jgi:hypothetical protein
VTGRALSELAMLARLRRDLAGFLRPSTMVERAAVVGGFFLDEMLTRGRVLYERGADVEGRRAW